MFCFKERKKNKRLTIAALATDVNFPEKRLVISSFAESKTSVFFNKMTRALRGYS